MEPEMELLRMAQKAIHEMAAVSEKERLKEARRKAVSVSYNRCTAYLAHGYDHAIVLAVLEKKLKLIKEATTVEVLKKLEKPSEPTYNGGSFSTDEMWVPEEELIQWSLASLKAPLSSAGFKRYIDLFQQVTGIDIAEKVWKRHESDEKTTEEAAK